MNQESRCPIWNTPASRESLFDRYEERIDSPRAGGEYFISGEAITLLPRINDRVKARLTSWLVDQRRLGVKCPEILQQTIKMAEQQKVLSVHDRADRLLQYIGDRTVDISTIFYFKSADVSSTGIAAWSESIRPEEVKYLLDYLIEQGWLDLRNGYVLTVKGYVRLAELETENAESSKGFVAMWFDDSLKEAWEEGIKRGIEDADFTQGEKGARGGVYYEAGFAHGLGIEVFFTCRKDVLDNNDIHFDTRQYNHIGWKTPEELRQRLAARISAVIGDGPHKENSGH